MEKFHAVAQVAKTLVLSVFLLMIPFISSSMRTSYLYFILNLLILVLAIESGILGAPSESSDEKKPVGVVATTQSHPPPTNINNSHSSSSSNNNVGSRVLDELPMVEKKPVEAKKVIAVTKVVQKTNKLKRSPSVPSLFFIGSLDEDIHKAEEEVVEEWEEEEEEEGDELFARAEMFIGNFYKQLKMQREESWKKIHGFYYKPF